MGSTRPFLEICWEAFAAFKRTRQNWTFYALYLLPLEAVGLLLNETATMQNKVDPSMPATSVPGLLFSFFVAMIAPYLFTATYLKTEPVIRPTEPEIGNYFYWLWTVILKSLIALVPAFLGIFCLAIICGILGIGKSLVHNFHGGGTSAGTAAALGAAAGGAGTAAMISVLVIIIMCLFLVYPLLRLYCAGPLAISRAPNPIKTSWAMTKGQCWRLFINGFVFALIAILCGLVPLLLGSGFMYGGKALYANHYTIALALFVIGSLTRGVVSILFNVLFGIYIGVVLRILNRDTGLPTKALT